ncbi:MAG: ferrous iron transport protein A [Chloroflexi bacterium]|nr:ferrous iron transport protein A [Chloroflexota bacterium]
MSQKVQLTLAQMRAGQSGTIVAIFGGRGLTRRLEAVGIRVGGKVTKISSTLFRGPVTLRANHTQVAIGYGMANKILVEVDTSS